MTRMRRIKVNGEDAYYHIISRTVQQTYLMGNVEREKFVSIIKHYSDLYFVKVIAYCIMDNHFHLLVKMEPEHKYTDEEIEEKVRRNIKLGKDNKVIDIAYYRNRLENISEYMRQIKHTFSRWYNNLNNTKGSFWSDRFKSVLVEQGEALETVLAYIELNPIRAKIVKIPEEYRHSSIGYRTSTRRKKQNFLSFDGLTFEGMRTAFSKYRKLIYQYGGIDKVGKGRIDEKLIKQAEQADYQQPASELFTNRIKYLTDGLIIGSKTFLKQAYAVFGGNIIMKKNRHIYKTGAGNGVLSVRKLIE